MAEASDPGVEALLAFARMDFASRLGARGRELASLSARGAWAEVRLAAHRLRGSCATYGFAAPGQQAGRIEDLLLEVGCEPGPDDRVKILGAVADFLDAADRAAAERG